MARTGTDENKAANQQYQADQNKAFGTGQAAIGTYNKNIETLDQGGQVAQNPWRSAQYLSNVNRLQAGALNANTEAGAGDLRRLNARTGGLNGSATSGAITKLRLGAMRLGSQLGAERTASDYNRNVDYQREMAAAPLATAGAESPYFGTATSGRDSALGNLTQFGLASYSPYTSLISAAGQAGGAALTKYCWIAEAIYGKNDWRTHAIRAWLNGPFERTRFGAAVMALYGRYGRQIAAQVKRYPLLGKLLKPLFELALARAIGYFNAHPVMEVA